MAAERQIFPVSGISQTSTCSSPASGSRADFPPLSSRSARCFHRTVTSDRVGLRMVSSASGVAARVLAPVAWTAHSRAARSDRYGGILPEEVFPARRRGYVSGSVPAPGAPIVPAHSLSPRIARVTGYTVSRSMRSRKARDGGSMLDAFDATRAVVQTALLFLTASAAA